MEVTVNEGKSRKRILAVVIPLLVGIALICGAFAGFTFTDKLKAGELTDETLSYLAARMEQYDDFRGNEKAKSLINLADKANELSRCVSEENVDSAFMDEYAEAQRLTGAAVLDENRKVIVQTLCDGDTFALWSDVINTNNVIEIIKYPQKVYLTRTEKGGKNYDFAAVSRSNAPGIVIVYQEKRTVNEGENGMSIQSMLEGLDLKMNGAVVISDGANILGTNRPRLEGKTDAECDSLFSGNFHVKSSGLVKLNSQGRTWYGGRKEVNGYYLYAMFPASQVFKTRNAVIGYSVAAYIAVCLFYMMYRRRMDARHIELLEDHREMIKAIGRTYNAGFRIDVKLNSIEAVKVPSWISHVFDNNTNAAQTLSGLIDRYMAEPFRKEHLEYLDLATLQERLEGRKYLTLTYQDIYGDWFDSFIIPVKNDESGKPETVLLISQNINKLKESELKYKEQAQFNSECSERANKEKNELMRRVSHDIRTPVNGIRWIVGISRLYAGDEEKQEECRDKIIKSCGDLLDIVGDNESYTGVSEENSTCGAGNGLNGAVILLAEDNELNMEVSEFLLRSEGASVVKAWNGKEAADIFAASAPGEFDAVLMDIAMPVMDGIEAARRIRAMDRPDAGSIPIIAVTANAFTDDRNASMNAGMNEHISKPVDVERLITTINRYISK